MLKVFVKVWLQELRRDLVPLQCSGNANNSFKLLDHSTVLSVHYQGVTNCNKPIIMAETLNLYINPIIWIKCSDS